MTDEDLYLARCDDGLAVLQRIDIVILRLVNMGNRNIEDAMGVLFDVKGVKRVDIGTTVKEYCARLDEGPAGSKEKKELMRFLRSFEGGGKK